MKPKYACPTLVVNIEREHFAEILAIPPRKFIEYRDITPYWERRLQNVGTPPFNLRLLNGMTHPIPEATVEVESVDTQGWRFRLHLGRVLEVKHWDREREQPVEG